MVFIRCVSKNTGLTSEQIDIVIHFRMIEYVQVLLHACIFLEIVLIRFYLDRLLPSLNSPLFKDNFLEL